MSLYSAAIKEVSEQKTGHQYSLEISTPERTLYLAAETREDMEAWLEALLKASLIEGGVRITQTE